MPTSIFSFTKRDIPPKSDGIHGVIDESDLDFRSHGRKVAIECYERGLSFRIKITPNPDGIDWDGRRADFDMLVERGIEETRRIDNWRGLAVATNALYQAVLPHWFFVEKATADDPANIEQALELAESIAEHRIAMRLAQDILWEASTNPQNALDAATIQMAARSWKQGGLWLCYDQSQMYIWDQHTLVDGHLDSPPIGHKVYPYFSIMTGTFRNSNASAPHEPSYLQDCLATIVRMNASCPAEEYMVGDAVGYLQALRGRSQADLPAYLRAAQMALSPSDDQDTNNIDLLMSADRAIPL